MATMVPVPDFDKKKNIIKKKKTMILALSHFKYKIFRNFMLNN